MKILLLGATGRTGKLILQEAIDAGHAVTCLARQSERIPKHDAVTAIEGDPTNQVDLVKALEGCDAVISSLNVSRTSDFPWSKLRTPEDFLSKTMKLIISVAKEKHVKRLVICSAWGVAETKDDLPVWFKWMIDNSNIGKAYADHERQEQLLETSTLDWTIVRPVGLTNSKRKQEVIETYDNNPKPTLTISRQSLALYLVNCLKNDRLIKRKVVISKA